MCDVKSDKTKCMLIAVLSIVTHVIILCISIGSLVIRIKNTYQESKPSILTYTHGNFAGDTSYALIGITLVLCLLGITASVVLIIGIKYKKPGFLAIFVSYIMLASILLLLVGILSLLLEGRWRLAVGAIVLAAYGFSSSAKVYTTYDVMSQESSISAYDNGISSESILTKEFEDETDETFKNSLYSVA